jgi:hypothetical protein
MPRKRTGEGKRYPLNMRTTKRVRDMLEHAARRSGRSLVQEVEWRLESSLRSDGHLILARGDIWAPTLFLNGELLVGLGNDPRDVPVEPGDPPHEEHCVILKMSPRDLRRLQNYFSGAPYPWDHSNKEIQAAGYGLQRDVKRGK